MSRLLEPMKKTESGELECKFPWNDSLKTDVRATWDRCCPGWRDRKPTVPVTKERISKNAA